MHNNNFLQFQKKWSERPNFSDKIYNTNTPNDAYEYEFQLKSNDVVILATEDFIDNATSGYIELLLTGTPKM